MMNILVVGGGGREHTIAWKLAQDSTRPTIYCAPGNAGTAAIATNLPIGAEDVAAILRWAKDNRPDLTVVGPEAPLCVGLTDALEAEGMAVFGPGREAARMEGSKVFAKDVMDAAGVPTAAASSFTDCDAALAYVREQGAPIVVKAEGLAAGKGVLICTTVEEAEAAVRRTLVDREFGDAGARVVVEEFLDGEEASILALVDGERYLALDSSQDHKRVFDNDQGPNTGGMGAYSPAPVMTDEMWTKVREQVLQPTLDELKRRGIVYKGVLYAGVMVCDGVPKVLEFNCRFGDPETQAVLPRIDGDLLPALQACVNGTLTDDVVAWKPQACVDVVMASGGYPGPYEKGKAIGGIDAAEALGDVVVFHAGTAEADGQVVTSGGRVLGVTALGADLPAALAKAYEAIELVTFEGAHFRRDIAARAMNRE